MYVLNAYGYEFRSNDARDTAQKAAEWLREGRSFRVSWVTVAKDTYSMSVPPTPLHDFIENLWEIGQINLR